MEGMRQTLKVLAPDTFKQNKLNFARGFSSLTFARTTSALQKNLPTESKYYYIYWEH